MSWADDFVVPVKIPASPLPQRLMAKLCHRFRGIGRVVAGMVPGLETELRQADIHIHRELFGAAIFVNMAAFFLGGLILAAASSLAVNAKGLASLDTITITQISIGTGLFFAAAGSVQLIMYPKITLKKKIRDLEANLVFALRTMLVQVRSGVTLFDAINSVAKGDNGQVSAEFGKAVKRIDTGSYQNDALEELAENNPSLYFRRAIWQLVNGLKAGTDVSQVMESLVEGLSTEKSNQIKKYGNSLKMLSMLYMMIGAIVPALGLTLLIILSIFVNINETIFWGMFAFLTVGQFMFIGIIKNARPSLLGD